MEECAQCAATATSHPVIIIMKLDIENPNGLLKISDNGNWAAKTVCNRCHQSPRLKGHFFYRYGNWEFALNAAGASNLGG